jgi:hypothetical protein
VGFTTRPKVGVALGEAMAEVGSGVGVGTGVSSRGGQVGVGTGAGSERLVDVGVSPGKRRALHAVSAKAARDTSASAHDRFLRGPCLETRMLCFTHSPGDESIERVGRAACHALSRSARCTGMARSGWRCRHGVSPAWGELPLPMGSALSPLAGSTTPASMKPPESRLSPLLLQSVGRELAPQPSGAGKW